MATINKTTIRNILENQLKPQLKAFADEMRREAAQLSPPSSSEEMDGYIQERIEAASTKEAQKLANGIISGLDSLINATNENTSKIVELERRINELITKFNEFTTSTP